MDPLVLLECLLPRKAQLAYTAGVGFVCKMSINKWETQGVLDQYLQTECVDM